MIVSCDSRTNNTCKTSSLAENGISELFFKSLTYPEYTVGKNLQKKYNLGGKPYVLVVSKHRIVFQEKTNAFLAVSADG